MKTNITKLLLGAGLAAHAVVAQPTGQWDFNSGGLAATVGGPLTYLSGGEQARTLFNTTTGFGIPDIGGEVAAVAKVGPYEAGSALLMPTPAQPNAGGGYVNDYTLIMDILFPAESNLKQRAILDADLAVVNADTEFFVNADNGLGIKGAGFGSVTPDAWHRIGIVVDADNDPNTFSGVIRVYINGVQVGSRSVGNLKDDRFALNPGNVAYLFSDDDNETAVAYVNSIQIRDQALSKGQMLALGGATAAGIPQVLPPVPSGLEKWIPLGPTASRTTPVGAVISTGSTTIQDSSIQVRLNGTVQANAVVTRAGDLITVSTPPLNLVPGNKYTIVVSFTDSLAGARSFENIFTAALFYEDFESIVLGPGLEEAHAADVGWSSTPPAGWSVDNTLMAGFGGDDADGDGRPDGDGRSEWFGWNFANRDWWVRADDQRRSEFNLASGTVAIADPDEWDDAFHDQGLFNSILITPEISLEGVGANTVFLSFVSSWRPEALDDSGANFTTGPNGEAINNQTALVHASFDGGAPVQLMKWDSVSTSPTYHDHNPNEAVLLPLNNPAGARNVVLRFSLVEAANDWWWAVDNISLSAGASPPTITVHPAGGHYSVGGSASLTVTAGGTEPFTYQWKRNGTDIPGATARTLAINYLEATAGGSYTVVVSNAAGSVESQAAVIELQSGSISRDLVAHYKFDQSLQDSAKSNHGQPVGAPEFIPGKVGGAVKVVSGSDYVTLGRPSDLNFGTGDFSIAFWAQINGLSGDPSIIGNKDWNSGGNQGYVLFSASNRRIDWNLSGAPGVRKDSDGVANIFADGAWRHVVVTFDRDGNGLIYIDGSVSNVTALAASQNNVDTPEGFATNLGQDGTGTYGSSFSDLQLDEVGIWRRVLTAQEAKSLFEAGNAGKDLSQATFAPPGARVTGQWDFNNGDLSATVGAPLAYRGDTQAGTTFETMTINGQPAKVMGFPAATVEQGYVLTHGASPNGGGQFVNAYSVIMDVMFPADSTGRWRGLWQTSESNGNDGDFFVNTGNGIGISGNYSGQVLADTWHRIAFVVDLPNALLSKYIDGVQVGTQGITGIDGRYSLGATALIFTDEDGETAPGYVNSIQFLEGALRAPEVAALGGATAAGIGSGPAPTPLRASIQQSGASFTISVTGGGTLQLQRKLKLTDAAWTDVGAPSTTGSFTVNNDQASAFYRVVQTAP